MERPIIRMGCTSEGVTRHSLRTLDGIISYALPKYRAGEEVGITEVRRQDLTAPNVTYVSLELGVGDFLGNTGEGFWVPRDMQYHQVLESREGGEGTAGYEAAIANLYLNFNRQKRSIVHLDKDGKRPKDNGVSFSDDPEKLRFHTFLKDLDLGFDWNFIVMDISTQKNGERNDFIAAATWDIFSGIRHWYQDDSARLLRECNNFDYTVTFNGNSFDWNVLKRYGPEAMEILEGKSLDLYDMIKDALTKKTLIGKRSRQLVKGSTKLETLARVNLGMSTNVFGDQALPSSFKRTNYYPIDQSGLDVEITKELLLHILHGKEVLFPLIDNENNQVSIESLDIRLPYRKKGYQK